MNSHIEQEHDSLAPARGVLRGYLWGLAFWAALIAATVLLLARNSSAGEPDRPAIDTFFAIQKFESAGKLTYLTVLAAADYYLTVENVLKHLDQFHEMNPVLGRQPSRERLALFGAAGLSAVWAISKLDHPLARIIVDSIIATEQVNVWENGYVMARRSSMPVMIVFSYQF